jgi:hypothetical protein
MTQPLWQTRWHRWGAAALLGIAALASSVPAHAAPWINQDLFAAPAFRDVWNASDQAVQNGSVARSYTWGPRPWFDYKEYYRQSPNGLRQVQYFDKARMEINDPGNSTVRGVTNGLLTVEMVGGRVKLGDSTSFEENLPRDPATVPVAGDPGSRNPNAPTYASFRGVATVDNDYRDPDRTGQRTGATLDKLGNRTVNETLAQDPATEIVAYNTVTGHNVPRVFRDFLQNGPVDALFAFGYPITDPYWVRARVAGEEKDIFVQLYERRVVTYTPSNPAAFRVEMGNVGQHYFQWRYPHLGQPWLGTLPAVPLPIAFASKRATADHWEVFTMDREGNAVSQLTSGTAETVPYSWRRSYAEGASPRLIVDSKRAVGRQVFSINIANPADVRQHTTGSETIIAFNGAISPDGTQIATASQASDPGGQLAFLSVIPFSNDQAFIPPNTPVERGCRYESPSWLPDGSGLVFAGNCGGKFAIYRGDLQYQYPPSDQYIGVQLVNIRPLTNTPDADNYFPRVSPDGRLVVFSSNRNGQGDLYTINIDGTGERRLTSDPADDGAASWSFGGLELVFDSNRGGDYEIFRLNLDTLATTQLTDNNVDDRWPLWEQ